jgi:hypothetical protein
MHRPLSLSQRAMLEQGQISNSLYGPLPNGATMESYHTAELDTPGLNADESNSHTSPRMANHSLLAVGQLCDERYIITFKQDEVIICNSGNTGLCRINLRKTNNHKPEPIANKVYDLRDTGL